MHRANVFFATLGFLTTISTALTLPSLTSLTQQNLTASPFLHLNPAITNHRADLNNFLTPECGFTAEPSRINRTVCILQAKELCTDLATHGPEIRNDWHWSESHSCRLAYYFPDEAIPPTQFACADLLYGSIFNKCLKVEVPTLLDEFNGGWINVLTLPGWGRGAGTAIIKEQARYLVIPGSYPYNRRPSMH